MPATARKPKKSKAKPAVKKMSSPAQATKTEDKPKAKRNGKKFGLKLFWKSHFDPTRERAAITWYKTEGERDKAIDVALKDKRPDGSARYTNMKKLERD